MVATVVYKNKLTQITLTDDIKKSCGLSTVK